MKLLSAVFSLLFLFSCQEPGPTTAPQGKNIYYYPSSNIYFDADNNQYILRDGEKGWAITNELLPEQAANLGRKVLVLNPTVPVWKANNDHKMVYAASLYTTHQDYREKFTEDSLNSLPKKQATLTNTGTADSTEQKKERRGVGKFLDRIFGGKNKQNDKKEETTPPGENS